MAHPGVLNPQQLGTPTTAAQPLSPGLRADFNPRLMSLPADLHDPAALSKHLLGHQGNGMPPEEVIKKYMELAKMSEYLNYNHAGGYMLAHPNPPTPEQLAAQPRR